MLPKAVRHSQALPPRGAAEGCRPSCSLVFSRLVSSLFECSLTFLSLPFIIFLLLATILPFLFLFLLLLLSLLLLLLLLADLFHLGYQYNLLSSLVEKDFATLIDARIFLDR